MAPLVKLTIFKPIEVYISNIRSHLLQYRHLHVNNGYCYCINFAGGVTRYYVNCIIIIVSFYIMCIFILM